MLRILLFAGTNIAVLLVLALVMRLTGLDQYLEAQGLGLVGLLIFSAVLGFSGALISLFLSKPMAIRSMRVHVIKQPANEIEAWLVATVRRQAEAAGIGMPDVGIYEGPEMNAFATGASRNNALVAVSTGLLRGMTRSEVEAVLGHEVAHVANGDMVTMTLLQGVLNTFVIFLARVIGSIVDRAVFRNERGTGPGYFIVVLVAQVVLGVLASMIAMWFSRYREFRADEGGARLTSRRAMAAALRRLAGNPVPSTLPEQVEAMGISGRMGDGLKRLFMSHPPLEERIARLERGA